MAKNISVDFTFETPSGTATEKFYPSSCRLSRNLCSATLRHQENSVSLEFPYEPELFRILVLQSEISAKVYDSGELIFTGITTKNPSWTDRGRPLPIESLSVEISDFTVKLDHETEGEIGIIETNLADVASRLFASCGISVSDTTIKPENTRVPVFIADKGASYKSIVSDLLFQYGWTYYFNEKGEVCYFDFSPEVVAYKTLDENDMLSGVKPQRQNFDYNAAKVTYNELVKKQNELVYFQGSGYDSDENIAPTIVQPGVYYPFESTPEYEEREGQVFQSFFSGYARSKTKFNGEIEYERSGDTALVYTQNQRVVNDWSGDIDVDRTEFSLCQASVRLRNNGTMDAKVYSISIRADAWYRDIEKTFVAGAGSKQYTCDCERIFTETAARTLAKILYKFFCGKRFSLSVPTEKEIAIGTYYIIDTGISGFVSHALAIKSEFDPETEIYTTTFITCDLTMVDISRYTRTLSQNNVQGANGANGTDGDDGISLYLENNAVAFAADSSGNINEQTTVAHVVCFQGTKELDVHIGKIEVPAGFEISVSGKLIYIKALSGNLSAQSGTIQIPVYPAIKTFAIVYGKNGKVYGYGRNVYGNWRNAIYIPFVWSKAIEGKTGQTPIFKDYYLLNDSPTAPDTPTAETISTWSEDTAPVTSSKKYLWKSSKISIGTDDISYSQPVLWSKWVTDGTSVTVSSAKTYYAVSDTENQPAVINLTEVPNVGQGQWLWSKTVVTYSDNKQTVTYAKTYNATDGDDGVGIESVTEHYLATSASSGVTKNTSGWTETIQTVTSSKKYLWIYETITYTDGSTEETSPVIRGVYGDKGENAVSVSLSQSTFDVICGTNGKTLSSQNIIINVVAKSGASDIACEITTPTAPSGVTFSKNNSNKTITITIAKDSTLGGVNLSLWSGAFQVKAGGSTFSFTVTIKKRGPSVYLGRVHINPLNTTNPQVIVYTGANIASTSPSETKYALQGDYVAFVPTNATGAGSNDGKLYLWNGEKWIEDNDSAHKFMAIKDLMLIARNSTVTEFVNNLVGYNGFFENFFSKTMTLLSGGLLKSDNYNGKVNGGRAIEDVGGDKSLDRNATLGIAFDTHGNVDLSGNTRIGGNVDIDGQGTIGKNMAVKGFISQGSDVMFLGEIVVNSTGGIFFHSKSPETQGIISTLWLIDQNTIAIQTRPNWDATVPISKISIIPFFTSYEKDFDSTAEYWLPTDTRDIDAIVNQNIQNGQYSSLTEAFKDAIRRYANKNTSNLGGKSYKQGLLREVYSDFTNKALGSTSIYIMTDSNGNRKNIVSLFGMVIGWLT